LERAIVVEAVHDANQDCPCCRYPTLSERGGYEICVLCGWEDDGQDDPYADERWWGPNGGYSLTAARANFADSGRMFAADDDERPDEAQDAREARRILRSAYDTLRTVDEPGLRDALMLHVDHARARLHG